jgi:hypothetical protein
MKTITVQFKDIKTGAIRFEEWQQVECLNIKPCYKAPDGEYYTRGIIGLFNVTRLATI